MSVMPEYDEVATMQETVQRVHEGWQELRKASTSGQKAWLTQVKKHYMRLIATDAEAAAQILAINEYSSQRDSLQARKARNQLRLSDVITVKERRKG